MRAVFGRSIIHLPPRRAQRDPTHHHTDTGVAQFTPVEQEGARSTRGACGWGERAWIVGGQWRRALHRRGEAQRTFRRVLLGRADTSQPHSRTHEPPMAMAAAAAAAASAPTGAGELEGLVQETVSFLGGLWSSGSGKDGGGKQGDDKIGESAGGRAPFEDFDMLVSAVGSVGGWIGGFVGWVGWIGSITSLDRLTDKINAHA